MMNSDRITVRQLAMAVRYISIPHLQRLRKCSHRTSRRLAARLIRNGWAKHCRLLVQRLEITSPIAFWKVGQVRPDAARISRIGISRLLDVPLEDVDAITATNQTLRHFGLDPRPQLKRFQQTHDLGLSETFVYFHQRWPRLTSTCWIGEDCFRPDRERGDKIEDAQIVHRHTGEPMLVVEFIGKYKTPRVQSLLDDIAERQIPFVCF